MQFPLSRQLKSAPASERGVNGSAREEKGSSRRASSEEAFSNKLALPREVLGKPGFNSLAYPLLGKAMMSVKLVQVADQNANRAKQEAPRGIFANSVLSGMPPAGPNLSDGKGGTMIIPPAVDLSSQKALRRIGMGPMWIGLDEGRPMGGPNPLG
jgi:hypothetical protein